MKITVSLGQRIGTDPSGEQMHTLASEPGDRSSSLIVLLRDSPPKIANYPDLRNDFLSLYINAPKAICF